MLLKENNFFFKFDFCFIIRNRSKSFQYVAEKCNIILIVVQKLRVELNLFLPAFELLTLFAVLKNTASNGVMEVWCANCMTEQLRTSRSIPSQGYTESIKGQFKFSSVVPYSSLLQHMKRRLTCTLVYG